jgi:hypothetical protein
LHGIVDVVWGIQQSLGVILLMIVRILFCLLLEISIIALFYSAGARRIHSTAALQKLSREGLLVARGDKQ